MDLYKDSTKPIAERVEDLLSRMTLEEKAGTIMRRSSYERFNRRKAN